MVQLCMMTEILKQYIHPQVCMAVDYCANRQISVPELERATLLSFNNV